MDFHSEFLIRLRSAEFSPDKIFHSFTPAQVKPERPVFPLRNEFKSEEWAAEPLSRDEFGISMVAIQCCAAS